MPDAGSAGDAGHSPDRIGQAGRSGLMLRTAVVVFALACAGIATGASLDRATRVRPELADAVPGPFQAEAMRSNAVAAIEWRRWAKGAAAARAYIAANPLNPNGSSVLAVNLLGAGDQDAGTSALRAAGKLGWRDMVAQLFWVDAAMAAGDFPVAAQRLDAVLRMKFGNERPFQVLRQLEATPAGREALVQRLVAKPSWLGDYVAETGALTGEALAARLAMLDLMAKRNVAIECQELGPAVNGLFANGGAVAARQLWLGQCVAAPERTALLQNPAFTRDSPVTMGTPFEWELFNSSGLRVDRKGSSGSKVGGIDIASDNVVTQVAARQYLMLAPGAYRLDWEVGGDAPDTIGLTFSCASISKPDARVPLLDRTNGPGAPRGRTSAIFQVGAGCGLQWLGVSVAPGGNASVERISIQPADR